jgi:hypothetical protein
MQLLQKGQDKCSDIYLFLLPKIPVSVELASQFAFEYRARILSINTITKELRKCVSSEQYGSS